MKMTTEPLVTIGIPTHNRADDLRHTLEAIRRWDYERLEVLVSDNASPDHTERVAREAAAADGRVRYVRHPKSLGLYGNHNFCIEASRGELLCFVHDHDEHDPSMVSGYVRFLQEHPRVGAVSSDWELIDEAGRSLGLRVHAVPPVTPGLAYIEQTIKSGRSSIGIPGAMVRRQALDGVRFDERGHIGFGDFVVWCRVAERWDIGHLSQRLWRWRQHPKSQSARTIVSLARDYDDNLNAYCDGYLSRHPDQARRVAGWRQWIRQYLFWALAYEVGLASRAGAAPAASPTLFEILGYRLTDEQFHQTLDQLRAYRTGVLQQAAWLGIEGLVRLRLTRPLAWATYHYTTVRSVLGLR